MVLNTVKITITQEYLKKGIKKDAQRCPISLFFREKWGNLSFIHTQVYGIYLQYVDEKGVKQDSQIDLPHFVQGKIMQFDCGEELEPYEFEVKTTLPPLKAMI